MKPSLLTGCPPLRHTLRTNAPYIISFIRKTYIATIAVLLILITVAGCGNNKRKKIKLHARDSAAVAISGRWDRIHKLPANKHSNPALQKYNIIALELNEEHTASIFSKDSALIKEFRGNWVWNRKASSDSSASDAKKSSGILISVRISPNATLEFEVTEGMDHGKPLLTIPDVAFFRKEEM